MKWLIWDLDIQPPTGDWMVVFWKKHGNDLEQNQISIPSLVEERADELKKRLLGWIYDLGHTVIQKKRLIDHLELREGFSCWWMTLLVEGNQYKTSRHYDMVKLFVLGDLVNELSVSQIILATYDRNLVVTVKRFCRSTDISFKKQRQPFRQIENTAQLKKRLFNAAPYWIQAFTYLIRYVYEHYPRHKIQDHMTVSEKVETTFVDYLVHLDRPAAEKGQFVSNFWTILPKVFSENGRGTYWIHHCCKHEFLPTIQKAHQLINKFNDDKSDSVCHSSLDSMLDLKLVGVIIRDYLRLMFKSIYLASVRSYFRSANDKWDLWPLLKHDWLRSVRGLTAMENCVVFALFEKKMSSLPRQKQGIYLQENQPWEMAFIFTWRASGHGQLIGVPHTTVAFWDLIYFFDPRYYVQHAMHKLPMPDRVAVNGPRAMRIYLDGQYPAQQLVEVEALRYLYLDNKKKNRCSDKNRSVIRLLICCDYNPVVTKQMLDLLVFAANELPEGMQYTLKLHPASHMNMNDYSAFELSNEKLEVLLQQSDIVYASNITSAAVEAFAIGLPVIQALNNATFNISPLRGLFGVTYVSTSSELAKALHDYQRGESKQELAKHGGTMTGLPNSYFHLDVELPRWQTLLDINK